MSSLEDLPNELLLQVCSYLNQFELLQCFLQLNERWTDLLHRHMSHLPLSMDNKHQQTDRWLNEYFPRMKNFVRSVTIDHPEMAKAFLQQWKCHPLVHLSSLELIDQGLEFSEELLRVCQPERLKIVQTPFYHGKVLQRSIFPSSLRRLEIDAHVEPACENCCFHQLDLSLSSILVDLRLSFSQLSSYIGFSSCLSSMAIVKLSLSIFSIADHESPPRLFFPELIDFQLEIPSISLDLFESLLPWKDTSRVKRLAFTGRLTNSDARQWKRLLEKYPSLERWDLQLFDHSLIDLDQWHDEFPHSHFVWNRSKNAFRLCSSTFDRSPRLCLNECLTHLDHPQCISHLILRSQYWCSYFPLSSSIERQLISRFHSVRRLSISHRQLRVFYRTTFLQQIERLDLEFAEQFCRVDDELIGELPRLKSVYLSSMYDGVQQVDLHSTLRALLREKFVGVNFLSIDSVEILGEEQIEASIAQWFPLLVVVIYNPRQSFSIQF